MTLYRVMALYDTYIKRDNYCDIQKCYNIKMFIKWDWNRIFKYDLN